MLGLITNGGSSTQRNKLKLLNIGIVLIALSLLASFSSGNFGSQVLSHMSIVYVSLGLSRKNQFTLVTILFMMSKVLRA